MKNKIIKTLITLIMVSIGILLINNEFARNKEPKIGSVYFVDWSNKKDPFDKQMLDTFIVLDVKEGFVKYESKRYRQVSSTRISSFNYIINN